MANVSFCFKCWKNVLLFLKDDVSFQGFTLSTGKYFNTIANSYFHFINYHFSSSSCYAYRFLNSMFLNKLIVSLVV